MNFSRSRDTGRGDWLVRKTAAAEAEGSPRSEQQRDKFGRLLHKSIPVTRQGSSPRSPTRKGGSPYATAPADNLFTLSGALPHDAILTASSREELMQGLQDLSPRAGKDAAVQTSVAASVSSKYSSNVPSGTATPLSLAGRSSTASMPVAASLPAKAPSAAPPSFQGSAPARSAVLDSIDASEASYLDAEVQSLRARIEKLSDLTTEGKSLLLDRLTTLEATRLHLVQRLEVAAKLLRVFLLADQLRVRGAGDGEGAPPPGGGMRGASTSADEVEALVKAFLGAMMDRVIVPGDNTTDAVASAATDLRVEELVNRISEADNAAASMHALARHVLSSFFTPQEMEARFPALTPKLTVPEEAEPEAAVPSITAAPNAFLPSAGAEAKAAAPAAPPAAAPASVAPSVESSARSKKPASTSKPPPLRRSVSSASIVTRSAAQPAPLPQAAAVAAAPSKSKAASAAPPAPAASVSAVLEAKRAAVEAAAARRWKLAGLVAQLEAVRRKAAENAAAAAAAAPPAGAASGSGSQSSSPASSARSDGRDKLSALPSGVPVHGVGSPDDGASTGRRSSHALTQILAGLPTPPSISRGPASVVGPPQSAGRDGAPEAASVSAPSSPPPAASIDIKLTPSARSPVAATPAQQPRLASTAPAAALITSPVDQKVTSSLDELTRTLQQLTMARRRSSGSSATTGTAASFVYAAPAPAPAPAPAAQQPDKASRTAPVTAARRGRLQKSMSMPATAADEVAAVAHHSAAHVGRLGGKSGYPDITDDLLQTAVSAGEELLLPTAPYSPMLSSPRPPGARMVSQPSLSLHSLPASLASVLAAAVPEAIGIDAQFATFSPRSEKGGAEGAAASASSSPAAQHHHGLSIILTPTAPAVAHAAAPGPAPAPAPPAPSLAPMPLLSMSAVPAPTHLMEPAAPAAATAPAVAAAVPASTAPRHRLALTPIAEELPHPQLRRSSSMSVNPSAPRLPVPSSPRTVASVGSASTLVEP